tara:strand:- start:250 stop:606 length:357 start_codon:yes stop_codon:yes gene_type:complete
MLNLKENDEVLLFVDAFVNYADSPEKTAVECRTTYGDPFVIEGKPALLYKLQLCPLNVPIRIKREQNDLNGNEIFRVEYWEKVNADEPDLDLSNEPLMIVTKTMLDSSIAVPSDLGLK